MVNHIKEKLEEFKAHVPLINAVCNAGLRDRHWAAMSDLVGFELKRDEFTSLQRLLERHVGDYVKQLTELSDTASREWSFERTLDKMLTDWEGLQFEVAAWKATGTFVLKGGPVDEAQARGGAPPSALRLPRRGAPPFCTRPCGALAAGCRLSAAVVAP